MWGGATLLIAATLGGVLAIRTVLEAASTANRGQGQMSGQAMDPASAQPASHRPPIGKTTEELLAAQGPDCLSCVRDNGCLDPAQQGGTCELATGDARLFAGALPDGTSCAGTLGAPPVSETRVCLETLDRIFASNCARTLQETPCLCGDANPLDCFGGTATPTGPLLAFYECDFATTSIAKIQQDFVKQVFGAGMANQLVACAVQSDCHCFGK
jgi:hypothetical protein